MRKIIFNNGVLYHVYNRGTDKRNIVMDKYDVQRFLQSMRDFNSVDPIGSLYELSYIKNTKLGGRTAKSSKTKKLVSITAYCLNPNHFHLILKQIENNGISEFMKRLGGGYAWYFNNKHVRTGNLFQGKFKANIVDTNEYALRLSVYVNLNNRVHRLNAQAFTASSWEEYISLQKTKDDLCDKSIILKQFLSKKDYKNFAEEALAQIIQRKELLKEIEFE